MDKPHILVTGFSESEAFKPKTQGRGAGIPTRERGPHGQRLLQQYNQSLQLYENRRSEIENPISEELGIYLEIRGAPGYELPLSSLDTARDFRLRSLTTRDDQEVAVVFVPESRRAALAKKLEAYLDPDRDRDHQVHGKRPSNRRLVQSIELIKLADLRSFWTDPSLGFPEDDEEFWWELWLKKSGEDDPIDLATRFADRIDAQLGNTTLTFFDTTVTIIKASVSQLEHATELISNLAELRAAKATPTVTIKMSPKEQVELAETLVERIEFEADTAAPILVLDSGVNFNHPILSIACDESKAISWMPEWPKFDEYNPNNPHIAINDHGSRQAGLMLFGDLQNVLLNEHPIRINVSIESGRILPPTGNNDRELYGAITTGTASKVDVENPDKRRIYSLAVTAKSDFIGGQPTSWSSEIDNFTCGAEDGEQRLFVVAAGNNIELNPKNDFWEQVQLAEIEDPAQAWNAITVGSFTELTNIDDEDFEGWSAWASAGDVSPSARSSVNWPWRKHAPSKPDVVAEAGNRLISPDASEVTDADSVRLLTTSGRETGSIFETVGDSSAATALVSRQAAILSAEYPDFWPETIRGLIVHSAEWTDRMYERKGLAEKDHSPKIANEVMLAIFGHGVPNTERARYSANHNLSLIAQEHLQPFVKPEGAANSADPKLNEMVLHQLPWPADVLRTLGDLEVKMHVTLSYFVEPNAGRRGYRRRYSYQSHGLRFQVIRPSQSLDNFRGYVNGLAVTEDYDGPEGDIEGWRYGSQLRTKGCLHNDIWTGPAASLADMNSIAVYPVGGWWKYRTGTDRWRNDIRYSLIVGIETPNEDVDIYTEISNQIEAEIQIEI